MSSRSRELSRLSTPLLLLGVPVAGYRKALQGVASWPVTTAPPTVKLPEIRGQIHLAKLAQRRLEEFLTNVPMLASLAQSARSSIRFQRRRTVAG